MTFTNYYSTPTNTAEACSKKSKEMSIAREIVFQDHDISSTPLQDMYCAGLPDVQLSGLLEFRDVTNGHPEYRLNYFVLFNNGSIYQFKTHDCQQKLNEYDVQNIGKFKVSSRVSNRFTILYKARKLQLRFTNDQNAKTWFDALTNHVYQEPKECILYEGTVKLKNFWKQYRSRYCKLTSKSYLEIYENKAGPKIETVDLTLYNNIDHFSDDHKATKHEWNYGVRLSSSLNKQLKKYSFRCESKHVRNQWIKYLHYQPS